MKRKTFAVMGCVVIVLTAGVGFFLKQYNYESMVQKGEHWYTVVRYPFNDLGAVMVLGSIFATLLVVTVSLAFYHTHKDERTSFWS